MLWLHYCENFNLALITSYAYKSVQKYWINLQVAKLGKAITTDPLLEIQYNKLFQKSINIRKKVQDEGVKITVNEVITYKI